MKKIGIMTMHRIINYGSFMQAYGLKCMVEKLGYSVQFVDYEYENPIINNDKKNKKNILKKIYDNKNILNYVKRKIMTKKFEYNYKNIYLKELGVTDKYNIRPLIDELIIGSDEVFNCLQGYPVGFSRELFGYHYENIDVISYAACFGFTTLDLLEKYNITNEISSYLKKFKSLSVRDNNSFDIVTKLTNLPVKVNLDPVLVSDFDDMLIDNVKIKNYIIVYAYPGRISKEEAKTIKQFTKKHHKKIISIGFCQQFADKNLVVSPFELFAYFKHADYIITDTFHGAIFSIKSNANFCALIRDSNSNKLTDLLNRVKLNNRIITSLTDIENYYYEDIDYSETNKIIKTEKRKSINYLKDNLL